jgi:hypothetical protein
MWLRSALVVAGMAGLACVGGSLTAVASTHPRMTTARAGVLAGAAASPADPAGPESRFVPITPCRIVDTRLRGGPIAATSPRSFVAVNNTTEVADQGGLAGGCGVPTAATAVQGNVVSVDARRPGYLKIYPAGSTAPLASFLNFRDAIPIANGGTITLAPAVIGNPQFIVAVNRPTQVVIDVEGYYLPPMWTHNDSTGAPIDSSRVTGQAQPSTGDYSVVFDRDVTDCALAVSTPTPGVHATAKTTSTAGEVEVQTADAAQTPTKAEFYLTVTC